jgi:trehalose utilization protein
LTGAQPGQEDDLTARKFKRVVMCVRLIGVHSPKLSHLFRDLLASAKEREWRFIINLSLKREFCARVKYYLNAIIQVTKGT